MNEVGQLNKSTLLGGRDGRGGEGRGKYFFGRFVEEVFEVDSSV
jgi:hypothetical protein